MKRARRRLAPAPAIVAGAVLVVLGGMARPARAQVAPEAGGSRWQGPAVPDIRQRSGLLTRHVPIIPRLPHDPDRDNFYQTRRDDQPPVFGNAFCTAGMYGLPLPNNCAVSFAPYFWGKPGGCYGPGCAKVHDRLIGNLIHPGRPVYHYYSGGSYVPVYDLDPLVPGPGPYPYPRLYKRQHMGG